MLSIREMTVVGYGGVGLKDKKNGNTRQNFYSRSKEGRIGEGNCYYPKDYEDFGEH